MKDYFRKELYGIIENIINELYYEPLAEIQNQIENIAEKKQSILLFNQNC